MLLLTLYVLFAKLNVVFRRYMVTRRISAKEARNNFSDLLGSVRYSGDPVIVEKKGRPFTVLISLEDFERYQQLAKERLFDTVRAVQQDNKDADPDQVLADVTKAVEAVRQEEYERKTARH
jgi:prevent-host-death family protein